MAVGGSADYIGVYVPVFATAGRSGIVAYCVVFLALVAVWCLLGRLFAGHPHVANGPLPPGPPPSRSTVHPPRAHEGSRKVDWSCSTLRAEIQRIPGFEPCDQGGARLGLEPAGMTRPARGDTTSGRMIGAYEPLSAAERRSPNSLHRQDGGRPGGGGGPGPGGQQGIAAG